MRNELRLIAEEAVINARMRERYEMSVMVRYNVEMVAGAEINKIISIV